VVFGEIEVGFASLVAFFCRIAAGGRREDRVGGSLLEIEPDDGAWPFAQVETFRIASQLLVGVKTSARL